MYEEEKEAFALWLSLPSKLRQPKTKKELAEKLNVNVSTLTRWEKSPEVCKMADGYHAVYLRRRLGDILKAAVKHAINGNHNYAKIIIELARDSFNRQEINVTYNKDVSSMTDREIAERLYDLMSRRGTPVFSKEHFIGTLVPGESQNKEYVN